MVEEPASNTWQAPIMADDEAAMKRKFAAELAKNVNDPIGAAKRAFGVRPDLYAQNNYIAAFWPTDPVVREHVRAIYAEHGGELGYAPPKELVAAEIYEWAQGIRDPEARLKAYKLYADLRGFIQPKGGVVVNNHNTQNNLVEHRPVLVVTSFGGRDEWEKHGIEQQARLIASDIDDDEVIEADAAE